jgi:hypothetical protein
MDAQPEALKELPGKPLSGGDKILAKKANAAYYPNTTH